MWNFLKKISQTFEAPCLLGASSVVEAAACLLGAEGMCKGSAVGYHCEFWN